MNGLRDGTCAVVGRLGGTICEEDDVCASDKCKKGKGKKYGLCARSETEKTSLDELFTPIQKGGLFSRDKDMHKRSRAERNGLLLGGEKCKQDSDCVVNRPVSTTICDVAASCPQGVCPNYVDPAEFCLRSGCWWSTVEGSAASDGETGQCSVNPSDEVIASCHGGRCRKANPEQFEIFADFARQYKTRISTSMGPRFAEIDVTPADIAAKTIQHTFPCCGVVSVDLSSVSSGTTRVKVSVPEPTLVELTVPSSVHPCRFAKKSGSGVNVEKCMIVGPDTTCGISCQGAEVSIPTGFTSGMVFQVELKITSRVVDSNSGGGVKNDDVI